MTLNHDRARRLAELIRHCQRLTETLDDGLEIEDELAGAIDQPRRVFSASSMMSRRRAHRSGGRRML